MAARNERIERLFLTDPTAAQREKDWDAWKDMAQTLPYVSALRLYEDRSRALTHLVMEESVYTPHAGTRAKDRFKIIRCSVIRMSDFQKEMANALGVGPDKTDGYRPQQPQWGVKFFVLRSGGVGIKSIDEGLILIS